jgi:hypothetical protein
MKRIKCLFQILFLICLSIFLFQQTQAQKKKKTDPVQKEIDLKLSGYYTQVLRGKITEFKAYGKTFPLQSVEISPADGISVKKIKECQPDPAIANGFKA